VVSQLATGSIREVLPEDISEDVEHIIDDILKSKMEACARILVSVIRALEHEYGPGVLKVARDAILRREPRSPSQLGKPEEDLRTFCNNLEKGCVGSHRWKRVIDAPDQIGYRFHRCLWAEVFNELEAPDIGKWLCEADEPAVRSFNPKLGFSRTRTLMDKQGECDHVFYVKK